MSSLLIKGVKMPKNCGECFISDRTLCKNGCPIVEVPEMHGRLIDEDFIKKVLGERVCIAKRDPNGDLIAMLSVSLLPTVIEAEGEE